MCSFVQGVSCLVGVGMFCGFTSLVKAWSPSSCLLFPVGMGNLTFIPLHVRNPSACYNYLGGVVTGEDKYLLVIKSCLANGHSSSCLGAVLACTPQELRNLIASFGSCLLGISLSLSTKQVYIYLHALKQKHTYMCE